MGLGYTYTGTDTYGAGYVTYVGWGHGGQSLVISMPYMRSCLASEILSLIRSSAKYLTPCMHAHKEFR